MKPLGDTVLDSVRYAFPRDVESFRTFGKVRREFFVRLNFVLRSGARRLGLGILLAAQQWQVVVVAIVAPVNGQPSQVDLRCSGQCGITIVIEIRVSEVGDLGGLPRLEHVCRPGGPDSVRACP